MEAPSVPIGGHVPPLLKPTQALMAAFELPQADMPMLDGAAQPEAQHAGRSPAAGTSERVELRQGIRVASLNLMIRYQDGSELTEMPEVFRLPNAPHWFLGMCNLHGMLIPVLDLAAWFGVERPASAKPMLLVLGHGVDAAGVVIDGLPVRLRFDAAATAIGTDCAPPSLLPYVTAAQLIEPHAWLDLDVDLLLGALEQAIGPVQ